MQNKGNPACIDPHLCKSYMLPTSGMFWICVIKNKQTRIK